MGRVVKVLQTGPRELVKKCVCCQGLLCQGAEGVVNHGCCWIRWPVERDELYEVQEKEGGELLGYGAQETCYAGRDAS